MKTNYWGKKKFVGFSCSYPISQGLNLKLGEGFNLFDFVCILIDNIFFGLNVAKSFFHPFKL